MDAAKADCEGQTLGLGGSAMVSSLPLLSRRARAKPTALRRSSSWRWLPSLRPSCVLPPLPLRRSRIRLPLCYLPPRG
eukprot:771806-Pleurochrysis_carterae.AAC.1